MNSIKFKKYYIEPKNNYDLISVSVFRLQISYKSMDKYINGLETLAYNFTNPIYFKPNTYLRIYFDKSIIRPHHESEEINNEIINKWLPLLKKLRNMPYIQLIQFIHPDFILSNGLYHDGLFGTFIRFIPLFDYSINKNIETVFIFDIDVNLSVLKGTKIVYDKFINSKSLIHFKTKTCYDIRTRFLTFSNLPDVGLIMAGTIISKIKFPRKLLNDFVQSMQSLKLSNPNINGDTEIEGIKDFLTTSINDMSGFTSDIKKEIMKTTNFIYGIDEFFLNTKVLKYIHDNKIKHSTSIVPDISKPFFTLAVRSNYFKTPSDPQIKMFKLILGKYYNNNKSLYENYEFFDKIMFNSKSIYNVNNYNEQQKYDYIANNVIMFIKKIYNDSALYENIGFTKDEIVCLIKHKNPHFIFFVMH
jgi:hypothetical protein